MNFQLLRVFTFLYFAVFIGVLGLFLFWQYATIKEFHQTELNNFFSQTSKIVSILVKKEKKEIKDIILSSAEHHINDDINHMVDLNNIRFYILNKTK